MHVVIVTNYKKKLLWLVTIITVWLLLFNFGSYIIENEVLLHIAIDSSFEFSYPYSITVDNVFAKNTLPQQNIIATFFPSQPRISQFINYKSIEGNFSFAYPSAFELNEKTFTGGEILYHVDFHDNQNVVHGFMQVWNFSEELGTFLEKAKNSSQQEYKYFVSNNIEINNMNGYLWDYVVAVGNNYYKGMEIFLTKEGRMYRMSYFIPENKWDDKQSRLFWKMAKSLKATSSISQFHPPDRSHL